ncbi:hypothetical protein [Acidisphaera sp. S103]|uniref:hypothetical protein n=1 Tax=Acidisphaera sp. S103 TaxID=1747223 RepID=UPI00131B81C3|nr:hypothetical protein [Acidisphaera sp. S103]
MWRFGLCIVALLASPVPGALAQTIRYTTNDRDPYQHQRAGHRGERRHLSRLPARAIDPYRMGPAPMAFLYRCDAPAGFYPYVPTCRMPWRVVPSGSRR